MELHKIEDLIKKYLNAETTLEEEESLKKYFIKKEGIPAHLQEYKYLFNYFTNSKLDNSNKTITLSKKRTDLRWLSVAAFLVLFIGIYSFHLKNVREKEQAKIAYIKTQNALNLIAYNLNKGNIAIAQLKEYEHTQNKIFINK